MNKLTAKELKVLMAIIKQSEIYFASSTDIDFKTHYGYKKEELISIANTIQAKIKS